MIPGAVLRLLVRRPVLMTAAAMLLVIGLLLSARHTLLYAEQRGVRIYVRSVCVAFTTFGLLAFGGFLAKAVGELEGVRLCRMVPGIRRKINTAMLIMVPVAGLLSTAFIHLALPDQFGLYDLPPVFLAHLFIFSLGIGLGWSWLQLPVLVVFIARSRWLFQQLDSNPALFSALILTACVALLHLRHRRFLVGGGSVGLLTWFASSFSIGARPRRTGEVLRDRPGWNDSAPSVALGKLIQAGALERLGQSLFGLASRTWFSVLVLYLVFGALSFWAWGGQKELSLSGFYLRVFLIVQPDRVADIMRVLFAIITGGLAFISSLLLDATLKPQLWHPLSRDLRCRAMFFSQLRQNGLFTGAHALAAVAVVATCALCSGEGLSLQALSSFLLPAAIAFVLMPIPQALFPNGVESFRKNADPKAQLLAGLTGGLICLLVAYWTSYWPLKAVHHELPGAIRLVLLGLSGSAGYFGYYHFLKGRFRRSDLCTRTV